MPSLGADMESGTLLEWLVVPGDPVQRGQVVAVVETTKGAIEIEIFEAGVIQSLHVQPGTEIAVGTLLARIATDESAAPDTSSSSVTAAPPEPVQPPEPGPAPVPAPELEPEPEPEPSLQPPIRPRASPAARRRARELGLDLNQIRGSHPGAPLHLADVERSAPEPPHTIQARTPRPGFDPAAMRRTIAAAMSRSKREIPHFYLRLRIDLGAAERWLADYNRERPPAARILLSALLMKASALALRGHPELNGHYEQEQGFTPASAINLGMAIHLRGGGLVAPAIAAADQRPLPELMQDFQDLVRRARSGALRSSEITGVTATVTALGDLGVDTVYGVIHPPQVAMIGFGSPMRRPWAIEDAIAIRTVIDATLAADHRVCDGHLGASFLNEIARHLQQPDTL